MLPINLFAGAFLIILFSLIPSGFTDDAKPSDAILSKVEISAAAELKAKEYYAQATDEYRNNNLSGAVIYFEKALRENPQDLQPLYWMNQACGGLALTNVPQSIHCYEREAILDPKNASEYNSKIAFENWYYLKKSNQSIEFYKKSINELDRDKDPQKLADAYLALGAQYALLKNENQELDSYRQAKDICEKAGLNECVNEAQRRLSTIRDIQNSWRQIKQNSINEQHLKKSFDMIFLEALLLLGFIVFIFFKIKNNPGNNAPLKKDTCNTPKGLIYISRCIVIASLACIKVNNPLTLLIEVIILLVAAYIAGQLLKFRKWAWYTSMVILLGLSTFFTYLSFVFIEPISSLFTITVDGGMAVRLGFLTGLTAIICVFLPAVFFYFSFFYLFRPNIKDLFR